MQQARLPLSRLARDSLFGFDVVHFVYYLICHFLLLFVCDSLTTLRLLSLLVTLMTCWNIFKIGTKIHNTKVGAIASAIFILLPITFDYATQARSSSLVTFLVSLVIINLLEIDRTSSSSSIIKTNLYFGLQILFNVTSVICLPIYLLLVRLKLAHASLIKEFRRRFFLPLVSSIPLAMIAKSQDNQIAWIGNDYSSWQEIPTVFLFPFVESEGRYRGITFLVPVAVTFLLLILSTLRSDIKSLSNKLYLWLVFFFLFPPLILWLASFAYPIFLTRYIAYASLPFAIILAVSFYKREKQVIQLLSLTLFSLFSLMNIVVITNNRDQNFNWKDKYSVIAKSPESAVVISSPDWYEPMLKYYLNDSRKIYQISKLETISQRYPFSNCNFLPNLVWLVGISDKIVAADADRLEVLGYSKDENLQDAVHGIEYFSLKSCIK